jgi:DNA-binding GntR family transcriptional regulator
MKLRRGAYVTEVSERDLAEVYHLLALLESDAASVAAERASPQQMRELQELHHRLAAASSDREEFFRINEAFHRKLLAVADNRWREQMVADLRKVMKLNRHHSLLKAGRIDESLAEHAAIMQALEQRDPSEAGARMREHFHNGLQAAA